MLDSDDPDRHSPSATAATDALLPPTTIPMHDTDRRRLFLAAIVTLIAVPAFFVYSNRADGDDDPSSALPVATASGNVINPLPGQVPDVTTANTEVTTSDESQLPPLEAPDDDPIFMNGPVAIEEDTTADVAIPGQPAIPPMTLNATYLSTIAGVRSCLVAGIESGRTISVTNLDNGRSITCVTITAPATQGDELVMHTESFEQLADLTEAPIAVEVRQ